MYTFWRIWDPSYSGCLYVKIVNCHKGSFPLVCLGIPRRLTKLLHDDWQPLLDKIDRRLGGWKGSRLSRGGKFILVNSVLTPMPFYLISFHWFFIFCLNRIDIVQIQKRYNQERQYRSNCGFDFYKEIMDLKRIGWMLKEVGRRCSPTGPRLCTHRASPATRNNNKNAKGVGSVLGPDKIPFDAQVSDCKRWR